MTSRDDERSDRLRELLSALVDERLDGDGFQELRSLLADERNADEYIDFMASHVALQAKFALDPCDLVDLQARSGAEEAAAYVDPRETRRELESPTVAGRTAAGRRRYLGAAVVLALAASLATVSLFSVDRLGGEPGAEQSAASHVGVLSRVRDARWAGGGAKASPCPLMSGDVLDLIDGVAEITLDRGVVVAMRGPAQLELISPMRVKAIRGVVRARVGENAKGFVIETPSAEVVDLGTEFGVDVGDSGSTDVVVFEGAIDLGVASKKDAGGAADAANPHAGRQRRAGPKRLTTGEALRVDMRGVLSRVVSIHSDRYSLFDRSAADRDARPALIGGVSDNLRDPSMSAYYKIVRRGFGEDARAYVDRFHEWNGVGAEGMPRFLRGADYVLTFNSDKHRHDLQIEVLLTGPAALYVLVDDRAPPPRWLASDFKDTGADIGVDEGWWDDNGKLFVLDRNLRFTAAAVTPSPEEVAAAADRPHFNRSGVGPGESVDTVYSVWRRGVPDAGSVTLGALGVDDPHVSMYGIAATPLSEAVTTGTASAGGEGPAQFAPKARELAADR